MAAKIHFKISDESIAALRRLESAGDNLAPVMADIAEYLLDSTRERFKSESAPDGEPWQELSADWLAMKAENGHDLGILKMRGFLFDSLAQEFTETSATVGSNLIYAGAHQFGIEGKLPARPFLGISPADEREITEIIEDYLREPMAAA